MRSLLAIPCVLIGVNLVCAQRAADGPHDSSRWESQIRAFEEADAAQPPPKNSILFLGSSSIRMWRTLSEDFPGLKTIQRGFGGSHIIDSSHFADRIVLPYRPRQIILYAGDNDIAADKRAERVLTDFKQFVRIVHRELAETRISFIAIKPSIKRWSRIDEIRKANRLIAAYCRSDQRLDFIDIFSPMLGSDGKPRQALLQEDGLHLTREGYELWATVIRPHLR